MKAYIRNVVFGCPDPRSLGSFYAELLGMRIIREDWLVVARDEVSFPRLAFDQEDDYQPPRWPDPEHPQQLHLDLPVSDLGAAETEVLRLGAHPLKAQGEYRSYADPAGHPFCLYRDPEASNQSGRALPTRIGRVVYDCFSPRSLAAFYEELLDLHVRKQDSEFRVEIAGNEHSVPTLAFQHAQFKAARWPDRAYPQQIHLDLSVDDGEAANELALRLGAIPLPPMGGSCPVYADPASHPFCLCSPQQ